MTVTSDTTPPPVRECQGRVVKTRKRNEQNDGWTKVTPGDDEYCIYTFGQSRKREEPVRSKVHRGKTFDVSLDR